MGVTPYPRQHSSWWTFHSRRSGGRVVEFHCSFSFHFCVQKLSRFSCPCPPLCHLRWSVGSNLLPGFYWVIFLMGVTRAFGQSELTVSYHPENVCNISRIIAFPFHSLFPVFFFFSSLVLTSFTGGLSVFLFSQIIYFWLY